MQSQPVDSKKYVKNSRKIRSIQKRIRELHEQQINGYDDKAKNKENKHLKEQLREQYINESSQGQEIGQNQVQEQEMLQKTLFQETVTNIERLVNSNNRTIQRLERKNFCLRKHLENLSKIFDCSHLIISKDTPSIIQQPNDPDQSQGVAIQYSQVNNQAHRDQFCYDSEYNLTGLSQEQAKISEQNYSHTNTKKQYFSNESLVDREFSRNGKRAYMPSKGPVRYSQQSWQFEQQFIKQFLNDWMKNNIEQTPTDPNKSIQKRIILLLYMKWRQLQNFNQKSHLTQAQIQQIITNEMKIVFRCKCALRVYQGITFIKKGEGNVPNQQKVQQQKSKSKKMNTKTSVQCFEKEDKLDQEFSIDLQQQIEYNDEENSYLHQ